MANIFIFGASNTCGAWDREGGWADRLKRYIFTKNIESGFKTEHMVYNLGVDGDDSRGLLKRIGSDFTQRMWEDSENIFIVTIGTNDTIYSLADKSFRVKPDEFRSNLHKIVWFIKKHATKIVFICPFPIDQIKVDPIPWLAGYSYKTKYIEQYRQIMKKVMQEEHVLCLDLYDDLNIPEWKKELVDGVHENTKAHEYIYNRVKDFLLENKII